MTNVHINDYLALLKRFSIEARLLREQIQITRTFVFLNLKKFDEAMIELNNFEDELELFTKDAG